MKGVWKLRGTVDFKEVGHNLFLIGFFENLDIQKVQEGRPWTFDLNLFSIKEYDALLTPNQVEFCKKSMWIQMHNIPFGMMNKVYKNFLEKSPGEIIEVDVDKDGARWSPFLRVKI